MSAAADAVIRIKAVLDDADLTGKLGALDGIGAKVGATLQTAGSAVTGFIQSSVQVGASFDSAMSQVAATMGKTTGEIGNLRDFAREMGATTSFSATEAAQALNFMALAGYDAEKSMEMLPNVLNLAASGGIALGDASDMVTDAQSALGLSMKETTELVDKMAQTSSKSNTSVAQLGEAILGVGGTAKMLAGGTTELSTALGLLADNGIKGSEGGTALRNILLDLTGKTKPAKEALEALGISAYDADGNMRPLNETFLDFQRALDGVSDKDRTKFLNDIFGAVDLKAVNALIDTSADRWQELGIAIDGAAGAAQQMADTQLDNLAGDVTMFQSALEGVRIAVADGVTPTLREFVQIGTDGLSRIADCLENGDLAGAADALGNTLAEGVVKITEKLPEIMEAGGRVGGALVEGIGSHAGDILNAAGTAVSQFVEGLAASAGDICKGFTEIVGKAASAIGEAAPKLIPAAVEVVAKFLEGLTNPEGLTSLVEGAAQLIDGLVTGIIQAVPKLLETVPVIIKNLVAALVASLPQILVLGVELIASLVTGILGALPDLIAAVPEILAAIVGGIVGGIAGIVECGGDIVAGLVEGITGKISWLVEQVTSFANSIVDTFKNLLGIHSPSTVFEGFGVNIVEGLINGIGSLISTVVTKMGEVAAVVINGIKELPGKALEIGKDIMTRLASGIGNMISAVTTKVREVSNAILNGLKELPGKMLSIGGNIVGGLKRGISENWGKFKSWLGEKVGGLVNAVKKMLGIASPSKVFAGIGGNMALGLQDGFADEYSDVSRGIVRSLEKTVNAAETALEAFGGAEFGPAVTVDSGALTAFADQAREQAAQISDAVPELAKSAMDDLAAGLLREAPAAYQAMREIGETMSAAFASSFSPDPGLSEAFSRIQGFSAGDAVPAGDRLAAMKASGTESSAAALREIREALEGLKDGLSPEALKAALNGMGVYMDMRKVGELVNRYQSNVRKATAT